MVRIIARDMVARGHDVRVIGVYPESYPAPDYEEDMGVKVWRLRTKPGKIQWLAPWFRQYKIISKWIKSGDVDLVEAPDSRGWFAFWLKHGAPLIIRSHNNNTVYAEMQGRKATLLVRLMERSSYRRADHYIAVSAFIAQKTKERFALKKDFTIIYNGIEIPPESRIATKESRKPGMIVYSGTLTGYKGVVPLMKALIELDRRGIMFHAQLCGKDTITADGQSMKALLVSMIPESLKDRIVFQGHIPREILFSLFKEAAVAVFPSYIEAFSLAPMEAMAYACPTIFTKRVSGPELIDSGIDGLLVEPDNTSEIADALAKLITDPEFADKLGKAGRNKILTNFTVKKMTEESVDFYEKVLDNKS
jgi:glycosyltransferase involved in cell wall biosynthesis